MASDDDPASAGAAAWIDTEGKVRLVREHIGRYHLRLTTEVLAEAVGLHRTQLSRLESGSRAWTLPVFAPVAGCLLGTLELITQQPWPLHIFFPEHRPDHIPAPVLPPADPRLLLCLTARSMPTSRPAPGFSWQLPAVLDRLAASDGQAWTLRKLARAMAIAEGQPEKMRTILNVLERLSSGQTPGSLPTLFRLHRFLTPRLSTPSAPFTLDDILQIPRWSLPLSALIRSASTG